MGNKICKRNKIFENLENKRGRSFLNLTESRRKVSKREDLKRNLVNKIKIGKIGFNILKSGKGLVKSIFFLSSRVQFNYEFATS